MTNSRVSLFGRIAAAVSLSAAAFSPSGCGYTVGPPYRHDVESVHVAIFESNSFRRDVEFQLTEAVHREIQKQTHFRITKERNADTKLTARIARIDKRVLGETGQDDARELQYQIALVVSWEDLRTKRFIMQERQIEIAPEQISLLSTGDFAPEIGQSMATARQRAVDNLARQIVQMMQEPW